MSIFLNIIICLVVLLHILTLCMIQFTFEKSLYALLQFSLRRYVYIHCKFLQLYYNFNLVSERFSFLPEISRLIYYAFYKLLLFFSSRKQLKYIILMHKRNQLSKRGNNFMHKLIRENCF